MTRVFVRATVLAASTAVVLLLALVGVLDWRALTAQAVESAADQAATVADAASDPGADLRAAIGRTPAGRAGDLAVHLRSGVLGSTHVGGTVSGQGVVPAPGGSVLMRPVTTPNGAIAVVEVYLPRWAVLGPWLRAMAVLVAGGVVAVAVAGIVGWRRIHPLVLSVRGIVTAAATIGQGRSGVRVPPTDAAEIAELVRTLNQISVRVEQLVAGERDFVADLSHRLRTPLTALRLDSESIGDSPVAGRVRHAVSALETDVDNLIRSAARATRVSKSTCDLAKVVRDRMAFWSTLADHQGRRCEVQVQADEAPVALPDKDVGAVVDSLVGNVFQHTAAGTPFAAGVVRYAGWVTLVVEDGGPGIVDTEAALRRGTSGRGSTGLGLDIARHAVEATGGTIHVDRGRLGGARIRLRFAEAGTQHDHPAPRAWRLWSHKADLPD